MLRMLYKSCERFNLSPDMAFSNVVATPPPFRHSPKASNGIWSVPEHGKVAMTFSIERAMDKAFVGMDEFDFGTFIDRHMKLTRLRPSFHKVTPLMGLFSMLEGQQFEQESFLAALAQDFLLTYPQVATMAEQRQIANKVVGSLLPCLEEGAAAQYLIMCASPTLRDCVLMRRDLQNYLGFNIEHPTGHYRLDLHNIADRLVADSLMLLDRWEASIDSRHGYINISQRGDGSHMRNVKYLNANLRVSVFDWHAPNEDELEFDYSSSKRPAENAGSHMLNEDAMNGLLWTLQRAGLDHSACVEALRMVSHYFYLTSLQARKLMNVLGSEDQIRCDLFVLVYSRIVDIQNEKIFRAQFDAYPKLVRQLQERLGFAVLFPFIQMEQWKFDLNFAIHDQRMAANMLFQLAKKEHRDNLRDFSYIHADGTRDPLTSGIPPGWVILKKMPLSGTIKGEYECAPERRKMALRKQLLASFGRWRADFDDAAIEWWTSIFLLSKDMVTFVEFLVSHIGHEEPTRADEMTKSKSVRFADLEQAFLAIDGPNGNKQINLNEFKDGVLRVWKFDRFRRKEKKNKKKKKKKKEDNDLMASLKKEEEGAEEEWAEDSKQSKRKDEEEELKRITAVFRFLDPGGEGEVSLAEWKRLGTMCSEIDLCLHEFMDFLDRVFHRDFQFAWEVLDADHSGEIDIDEWLTGCQGLGFFGAAKPIFNFIDEDAEGTVSKKEFFQLPNKLLTANNNQPLPSDSDDVDDEHNDYDNNHNNNNDNDNENNNNDSNEHDSNDTDAHDTKDNNDER